MPDTYPTDPLLQGNQAQANRRLEAAVEALRSNEESTSEPAAPRDWMLKVDSSVGAPGMTQYDPTRSKFVTLWLLGNLRRMGPWCAVQDAVIASSDPTYDFNTGTAAELQAKDRTDILVCTADAALTVTLPDSSASPIYRQRFLGICSLGGASGLQNMTVQRAGSTDVINGETSFELSPGCAVLLAVTGAAGGLWVPIARYGTNVFQTGSDITAKWWHDLLLVDTSVAARAITLRDPANELVGRGTPITVKNIGGGPGNNVTVTPENAKTIDGAANHVLADNAFAKYQHDGTTYWIH